MDVTLPNGYVIRGVPEGTSKEAIKAKAISAGLAVESDFGGTPAPLPISPQQATGEVPVMPDQMSQAPDVYAPQPKPERSMGEKIMGGLEAGAALTLGSIPAAVGQGVGAAQGLTEYLGKGDFSKPPGELVQQRAMEGAQRLTPVPPSQAGREYTQAVGEAMAPLAAVAPMAGEMAAIGQGIRTAPMAVAQFKGAAKTAAANRLLREAAPTAPQLKDAARAIYSSLDDAGVSVAQPEIAKLASDIGRTVKREGFNARIHPKVAAALDEISASSEKSMSLSEVDTMRRVARAAARSIDPDEARVGRIVVEKIDDFMDSLPDEAIVRGTAENVGPLYKQARGIWQRAKKSELISDAVEKAKNQASGFENGLRVQFRSLLNNKKKMQGFTADEKAAIQKVIRGGGAENTLKFLGKFGFTEGQATSMLGSSIGVAGGAAIGGAPGAVAVPMIGQMSKTLAQRLTRNNAAFADQIVRAGRDGKAIALSYIRNTPAKERSVAELSELLMRPGVNTQALSKMESPFIRDAAFYVDISRISAANAENVQNSMDGSVDSQQK